MRLNVPLYLWIFGIFLLHESGKSQIPEEKSSKGSIPIIIKDTGIDELSRGHVAMIFYITVTNTGQDPVHLFVNTTKCCQKITKEDEDCESMRPVGGDTGKLYPRDNRNLTLLFVNLYHHNRVGQCEIEIKDSAGNTMSQAVTFDTKLVVDSNIYVPRILQGYYKKNEVASCTSVDHDPLNQCRPYSCSMRYAGKRSYFNHTSQRCEKLAKCSAGEDGTKTNAYIIENNVCKELVDVMKEEDYTEFKEGKPGINVLTRAHSYPINVQCHNGKRDPHGRWCKCRKGWDSAPFDHKNFNMDLQVYHMCTVWMGRITDAGARNITIKPKKRYLRTNIVLFSILAAAFILVFLLLCFIAKKAHLFRHKRRDREDEDVDHEELVALTDTSQPADDD